MDKQICAAQETFGEHQKHKGIKIKKTQLPFHNLRFMNRKGLYILLYEENTLKTCSIIIIMDFVLLCKTDLSPLNKVLNEKG